MRATIHRGTHEIGGTLIELCSGESRVLLDAGYPLFLNGNPIEDGVAELPPDELLKMGVLPPIGGLYRWDAPGFDGVIISHAHLDHYGLLKYVHPDIPVYLSAGTKALIELSQTFKICETYPINSRPFVMHRPFGVGAFTVRPHPMDHSAFDAAAFEISAGDRTVVYSGDFRWHGHGAANLDSFIQNAAKRADVLFTEGTMLSRSNELTITEDELEEAVVKEMKDRAGIALVQLSSQNIDRIVSFYQAARKLGRVFVVDVYTANVLRELHPFGKDIPYPSKDFDGIKVFFPYRLTRMIFDKINAKYAIRFAAFKITKQEVEREQNGLVMLARPSMKMDLERCNLSGGTFFYSMWQGYRDSDYQKAFEGFLGERGLNSIYLHTSGHATAKAIKRLIDGLDPKKIVPIHTLTPDALLGYSDKVVIQKDGEAFDV